MENFGKKLRNLSLVAVTALASLGAEAQEVKKTEKPIIVHDKNDPRLLKYQQDLYLYTNYPVDTPMQIDPITLGVEYGTPIHRKKPQEVRYEPEFSPLEPSGVLTTGSSLEPVLEKVSVPKVDEGVKVTLIPMYNDPSAPKNPGHFIGNKRKITGPDGKSRIDKGPLADVG